MTSGSLDSTTGDISSRADGWPFHTAKTNAFGLKGAALSPACGLHAAGEGAALDSPPPAIYDVVGSVKGHL